MLMSTPLPVAFAKLKPTNFEREPPSDRSLMRVPLLTSFAARRVARRHNHALVGQVTRQRATLSSHGRIGIFRIFGRDAGFTAPYTAYVTSAPCVIPEYHFDLDLPTSLLVEDKRNYRSNYSFVIASEGALWAVKKSQIFGEADAYFSVRLRYEAVFASNASIST
jgi:6-phosphofructokinase